MLRRHLATAENGDLNSWWRLNLDLTIRPPAALYHSEDEFQGDLTKLEGWKVLSPEDRARCVQIAEKYLRDADPNTSAWLGKNIFYRPAVAAYRAIRLLEKLAPDQFSSLSKSTISRWAPVVLTFSEPDSLHTSETDSRVLRHVYEIAPDEVISALNLLMRQENENHGHIFSLRRMRSAWDQRLSDAIFEFVGQTTMKPQSLGSIFDELLEHRPQDADRVLEVFSQEALKETPDEQILIQLASPLLAYAPRIAWKVMWPLVKNHEAVGKLLLSNFALRHDELHSATIARLLEESDAADLYVWLVRQFPFEQDPKHEKSYTVGHREAIAMFRDSILHRLQEKGTLASCAAIEQIIRALPDVTWLKRVRPLAVEATMKESWRGQPPKVVLAIVRNTQSRIVESGEQLLDVIIESLKQLETGLQGTTPAVVDLWDERGKTPKSEARLSDYVKRHLDRDLRQRAVVSNREVEIRNGIGSQGEETDILVQAVMTKGTETAVIAAIIETKGCWNRGLKTAMETQLHDRYLKQNQCQHGLYLVGWFRCSFWDKSDNRKGDTPAWSIHEAREYFAKQASELSKDGAKLLSFVLDATVRSDP